MIVVVVVILVSRYFAVIVFCFFLFQLFLFCIIVSPLGVGGGVGVYIIVLSVCEVCWEFWSLSIRKMLADVTPLCYMSFKVTFFQKLFGVGRMSGFES